MDEPLLGDYQITPYQFDTLNETFERFSDPAFLRKNEHARRKKINRALLELIQKAPKATFLLPAIVTFIERVNSEKLASYYTFSSFEIWLNQFSGLSDDENYEIRCKVTGRHIARDEYQIFFPIGMGKRYSGTHFVTAHTSPDLDTTVASFWGWVDAFAARVGEGLHIWNVPGGLPTHQVEVNLLFPAIFGAHIFSALSKTRSKLTLCSFDLMTQRGLIRKLPQDRALSLDHERNLNAVIVVDPEGFYLGDWRTIDVEGVRQVVTSLENCLRWLEGDIHGRLISFFSTDTVRQADVAPFIQSLLDEKIQESEPGKDLTLRQQKALEHYLTKVLNVPSGFECTFLEFSSAMEEQSLANFTPFKEGLQALNSTQFFDEQGSLIEDRPKLFTHLKKMVKSLSSAFRAVRVHVEQLKIAMEIKEEVFGHEPKCLSYRADLEEVKTKMDGYPYLTVNYTDEGGKEIPVGVIHSTDLQKTSLGTVTVRDFCNRNETKIPPFLEVISAIDHHKTVLDTSYPPTAYIADAQSSNCLVASLAFVLNDRLTLGGMTMESIDKQIESFEGKTLSRRDRRILQRLHQKAAASQGLLCPQRETIEYLHYLYAILDDTDLLTKVSYRDVTCVAELLNRLKTLTIGREVEIVDFDDIPRDAHFVTKAAKKLLQTRDLYSLYVKVSHAREEAVSESIEQAARRQDSPLFLDTKVQNGCCRVGQCKLFQGNLPVLQTHVDDLRRLFVETAQAISKESPEIDLHLQMISTIKSAEELVGGEETTYDHLDELWIFPSGTDLSIEHLRLFLNRFQNVVDVKQASFYGEKAPQLSRIFKESFKKVPHEVANKKSGPTFAVLQFPAGTLNSRKAKVSPYLPHLSS